MNDAEKQKTIRDLKRKGLYQYLTEEQKIDLGISSPKSKVNSSGIPPSFFDFLRGRGIIGEEEYIRLIRNKKPEQLQTYASIYYNLPQKGGKTPYDKLRRVRIGPGPVDTRWEMPEIAYKIGMDPEEWNENMNCTDPHFRDHYKYMTNYPKEFLTYHTEVLRLEVYDVPWMTLEKFGKELVGISLAVFIIVVVAYIFGMIVYNLFFS